MCRNTDDCPTANACGGETSWKSTRTLSEPCSIQHADPTAETVPFVRGTPCGLYQECLRALLSEASALTLQIAAEADSAEFVKRSRRVLCRANSPTLCAIRWNALRLHIRQRRRIRG